MRIGRERVQTKAVASRCTFWMPAAVPIMPFAKHVEAPGASWCCWCCCADSYARSTAEASPCELQAKCNSFGSARVIALWGNYVLAPTITVRTPSVQMEWETEISVNIPSYVDISTHAW